MLSSNLFWNYIIILVVTIESYVLYKFLNCISLKKRSDIFSGISLIILIISLLLVKQVYSFDNIIIIINITLAIIYYKTNYEVKVYKCIMIIFIYWLVLSITETMSMAIVIIVYSQSLNIIRCNDTYKLQIIILSKVILISMFIWFKNKRILFDISKKQFIYISIPILTNMCILFLVFKMLFSFQNKSFIGNYIFLMSTITIGLSSIALIILIQNIIKTSNVNMENLLIKEKINGQTSHYKHVRNVYNDLRELKHDMKNHIICIERLHEDKELSKNYIENIKNRIENNTVYNTGNDVIDIILSEKNKQCIKYNIDFTAKVNIENKVQIENMDLCSIIANALDNAFEACCKINDSNVKKIINIKGNCINDFFLIIIENTKINTINIYNNSIITDKKDICNHGLGIDSIRKCVDKYNGDLIIDYTENKFSVKISIPVTNLT